MSYILEALRKVEQQREHLPVHGLSSRRRYYSAMDAGSRQRIWLFAAAALAGATLSGGVAAYLSADSRQGNDAQPQLLSHQTHHQPAPAAQVPVASNLHTDTGQHPAASHTSLSPVPARTTLPAPLRMPGPRHQAQGGNGVAQTQRTPAVTQNAPSQEIKPAENPQPTPEQEKAPETKQPSSPLEEETEVASVHPPSNGTRVAPPVTSAKQATIPHNRATNSSDPLDRIAPPRAVEVKPFRPNDVLRPPVARKNPPSNEPPILSTLSSQFQSMVPKMAINAQVYSPVPMQRFVVINMKRYNEGQNTAEGVSIVAIRQNDIVFAYQGQQFRLTR